AAGGHRPHDRGPGVRRRHGDAPRADIRRAAEHPVHGGGEATVSVGEDTVDPRRLIENIRAHLTPLIDQPPPPFALVTDPSPDPAAPQADRRAQDLRLLRGRVDPSEIRLQSHRKVFGWSVVAAKKLLRQLLTPVLEWQSAYNAAALRLLESLD